MGGLGVLGRKKSGVIGWGLMFEQTKRLTLGLVKQRKEDTRRGGKRKDRRKVVRL